MPDGTAYHSRVEWHSQDPALASCQSIDDLLRNIVRVEHRSEEARVPWQAHVREESGIELARFDEQSLELGSNRRIWMRMDLVCQTVMD